MYWVGMLTSTTCLSRSRSTISPSLSFSIRLKTPARTSSLTCFDMAGTHQLRECMVFDQHAVSCWCVCMYVCMIVLMWSSAWVHDDSYLVENDLFKLLHSDGLQRKCADSLDVETILQRSFLPCKKMLVYTVCLGWQFHMWCVNMCVCVCVEAVCWHTFKYKRNSLKEIIICTWKYLCGMYAVSTFNVLCKVCPFSWNFHECGCTHMCGYAFTHGYTFVNVHESCHAWFCMKLRVKQCTSSS